MVLPDFELPALEMEEVASNEPTIAAASARVQVGQDWLLLRECPNKDWNGTIVFLRMDTPDAPVLKVHRSPREESLKSSLKQPQKLLREWNWNRKLAFEDHTQKLRIRIFKTKVQWEFEVGNDFARWKFPHDVTLDWLLRVSDEEIRAEIYSLLQDPESDCSFARHWATLDTDERGQFAMCLQRDDWEEFDNVLSWVAWHCSLVLKNEEVIWVLYTYTPDTSITAVAEDDFPHNEYSLYHHDGKEDHLPKVVQQWLRLIDAYFRPAYRSELERYTAIQEVLQDSSFIQYFYVSFPSQHERLEARLQLHDWLQDKVAPEEIPILLGEQ